MKIAAKTDIGRRRKRNEDAFDYDSNIGFFIVADGMGGLDAGDIASKIALSVFQTRFNQLVELESHGSQLALLRSSVNEVNDRI